MAAVHDAIQVDLDKAAPARRFGVPEQRQFRRITVRTAVSGVVDQDFDRPQRLHTGGKRGMDCGQIGHICDHGFGAYAKRADLFGDGQRALGIKIVDDDTPRAVARQSQRDRPTHALAGAGNERDAPFEIEHGLVVHGVSFSILRNAAASGAPGHPEIR